MNKDLGRFDCVVVGGGVLGTTLAYWLSWRFQGSIAVIEAEEDVAVRTTGRNTGVIHRPFYLDPVRRRMFARSAQISYGCWKSYAEIRNLPWHECGTIEIATQEKELKTLEKYAKWSLENGMAPNEAELLTADQVKKIEPEVECKGAIFAKTDTSTDFGVFTRSMRQEAESNGAKFAFKFDVVRAAFESDHVKLFSADGDVIEADKVINCAGGDSVDVAHFFGAGLGYTDLHFRGEYWRISDEKSGMVKTNIYSVPRHPEIPFLDPHWICRADGRREIGPNAVMVAGSKVYEGFFDSIPQLIGKIFERPILNKVKLAANMEFLQLALEEWQSSISKNVMVGRVRRFIPKLDSRDLTKKGTAGVRSAVIDSDGKFVREALEFSAPFSHHVINFNSPGATGAPAYTARLADQLERSGFFSHMKKRSSPPASFWNFESILKDF
jgi:L-2-hydroxyglutarate oxidase